MVGEGLRGVTGVSLLRVLSVLPELLQVEGQPGYTGGVVGRKGRVGEATTPAVKRAQVYARTRARTHTNAHAFMQHKRPSGCCECACASAVQGRRLAGTYVSARARPPSACHACGRARDLAWAQAAGMIVLGFGNVSEACMWLEVRLRQPLRSLATVPAVGSRQALLPSEETRRAVAPGRRMAPGRQMHTVR